MELYNKVKTRLEETKGYDFSDYFCDGETLSIIYDTVYTTEKAIKQENNHENCGDALSIKTDIHGYCLKCGKNLGYVR